MVSATVARELCLTLFVVCVALLSSSLAQPQPFLTSRGDNTRSGANSNETLLAPSNVNSNGFGRLFSVPVDYVVMAQPLYVPNVNIPGQGTHNVIYVATQADSVYAIDADNGTQLWWVNFTNPAQGITTAQVSNKTLPCGIAQGFDQEGIIGTPVIDPTPTPTAPAGTMYLVAKTVVNGTVEHNLHALDITTGNDQPGSPVQIVAQSTSLKGHVTNFNSLHQKNRPGLLLLNGVLYLGFGSNGCNDSNSGWVLSYDPASLSQLAVFNTSPDQGLTSIWQAGNGLAADEAGNIFVETAEAGNNGYDIQNGGQTYCNSVVKLNPDLAVADYFTPWNVAYLNTYDFDLSSTGAIILPDQNGPYPYELIATGKQGIVYVLDRDNLGTYSPGADSQIIQEFALVPSTTNDVMFGSPAYWNNTVYFAPSYAPIMAFPLSSGLLGGPVQTAKNYSGGHSPSISASGNTNGIVWAIESGAQFLAFDAVTLQLLYGTNQAPNSRDKLPAVGHFVTPTVANGRVYVGTQASLEAYGLFHTAAITGGNAQTATVGTQLPVSFQVQIVNPYTGLPDVGTTVNFSDGGKGGSFSPASAGTDSNGNTSTPVFYTLPQKPGTYTLTISGTGFANTTTTATATVGPAVKIVAYSGANQTGAAGSNLAKPVIARARDVYNNGVPGVTVAFTANHGAIPSPSSVVTDANGMAPTTLQLPTTVSKITVTGSSTGFGNISFIENSVAGPASGVATTSGNNQSAPAGTQLPLALTVSVTDQYGNVVSGANVYFDDGGAGGTFSSGNPVITGSSGTASQFYTLPTSPGTITINATVVGVNPAVFTETGQ